MNNLKRLRNEILEIGGQISHFSENENPIKNFSEKEDELPLSRRMEIKRERINLENFLIDTETRYDA